MVQAVNGWLTSDGSFFTVEAVAVDHETRETLKTIIANQLGLQDATTDVIVMNILSNVDVVLVALTAYKNSLPPVGP